MSCSSVQSVIWPALFSGPRAESCLVNSHSIKCIYREESDLYDIHKSPSKMQGSQRNMFIRKVDI